MNYLRLFALLLAVAVAAIGAGSAADPKLDRSTRVFAGVLCAGLAGVCLWLGVR